MKTELQHTDDLIRLGQLIENMTVALFINIDGAGAVVSRPMAPLEMDGGGALWFFTDLRSSKIDHLSSVNVSFIDPSGGTYVSVSGYGEIYTGQEHIARLWTPLAKPWFPDGPDSQHLALLKVIPVTAEYWDASHSRMVRMLAMAASIVAGEPVAQGEHGTLTTLAGALPADLSATPQKEYPWHLGA